MEGSATRPEEIALRQAVRLADGRRFTLSLPFDAKLNRTKEVDLAKAGSFIVTEPGKSGTEIQWVATTGSVTLTPLGERLAVEVGKLSLRSEDGATKPFGPAKIEGTVERSCYNLVPNGSTQADGTPAVQHVRDTEWASAFCRAHK
jgi:hypothetical protein